MSGAADMRALSRVDPERIVLNSMAMVRVEISAIGKGFGYGVMSYWKGRAKGFLKRSEIWFATLLRGTLISIRSELKA